MVARADPGFGSQDDDVAHKSSASNRFRLVIMVRVLAAAGVDIAMPSAAATVDRRGESRGGGIAVPAPHIDIGIRMLELDPAGDEPFGATLAGAARASKRKGLFFARMREIAAAKQTEGDLGIAHLLDFHRHGNRSTLTCPE